MAAEQWWAVPEGEIGQLISGLTGHFSFYHAVQSATQPKSVQGNPVHGPYPTKAAAQAECDALNAVANAGVSAGEKQAAVVTTPNSGGSQSWYQQIGSFFGDLSNGHTWVRVGEVVLGIILIAVGVARITHAVPAATAIAKTAGAAAI